MVTSTELYGRAFEPQAVKHALASKFDFFNYDSLSAGHDPSVLTHLSGVRFGSVGVLRHVGFGHRRGSRGVDHIRTDHMDDFLLVLPVHGLSTISQAGSEIEVEPGTFAMLTTAKPFEIAIIPRSNRNYRQYMVRVPGPLLRIRAPGIDDFCQQSFAVESGVGAILKSLIWLSMREGQRLTESQSLGFGEMLVDAIANTTRDVSAAPRRLTSGRSSYARICATAEHFIESHISDPDLDPARVAKHCSVSVGYLHAAFSSNSKTVSTFIRDTRLLYCRAALRSQELRHLSVFQVALRWGFSDPAYFSRAYKTRFGKCPREDRQTV